MRGTKKERERKAACVCEREREKETETERARVRARERERDLDAILFSLGFDFSKPLLARPLEQLDMLELLLLHLISHVHVRVVHLRRCTCHAISGRGD